MQYYLVTYSALPEILFAHKYEPPAYELSFPACIPDQFEFSYIENGTLYFSDGQIFREGGVHVHLHSSPVHGSSHGLPHRHFTICLSGGKCTTPTPEELLKYLRSSEAREAIFFAIPASIQDEAVCKKIKTFLCEIIALRRSDRFQTSVFSALFALFSVLTEETYRELMQTEQQTSYADYRLCQKIKAYIAEHLYEKISVDALSAAFSLSRGHLMRTFKAVTAGTLVDYINKTKIDAACELLQNPNQTAAELAVMLSVSDEKYLCRLFRKYTGMTIRAYKALQKEENKA